MVTMTLNSTTRLVSIEVYFRLGPSWHRIISSIIGEKGIELDLTGELHSFCGYELLLLIHYNTDHNQEPIVWYEPILDEYWAQYPLQKRRNYKGSPCYNSIALREKANAIE
jgi:hypothetical protein